MEKIFNSIKERIQTGIKNNIPLESRLMMAGEIVYAAERKDLTPKEARTLEAMLSLNENIQDYEAVREQAIFGELIDINHE
ncbi:hypothetical protein G7B40_002345 [Aetokthonos hydrillicola Thurmond2011]|jgi:hypothetical protein|uniref:Uncharacterized protein n=1 Tax=Aetokthonos hydrillicola Thurmond2011 TaxID=2712845 RepID=A0AAP5I276_9CYAN|nr:hypothetical protein [Aetokthonos hydrillicola]MBO3462622.1 hypothetical protein [Aetokthonos hydrillicola CCALA 1050]MBW4588114.1 hypothetical protein [Aetokthonos hydrillicola CCALA 1050]MDR9893429.1 hypothetical protein [Aetokthonos hydrillicola Thurmond2011]